MKGNRTAAEEAARAAASLPIRTTAAEEAAKAAIGWSLHRSATEEAAKAAIGWPLHRSATEEAAKAAIGWQLHRTATEAAIQAIASLHLTHTNDIHKQIAATQSQLLKGLNASSFSAGITEIAKHAMMPLFQVHSATKIAAEAAQPFQHTDLAGMAVATLRDVDIRRLRGD